jgi:hypothetical protein
MEAALALNIAFGPNSPTNKMTSVDSMVLPNKTE